MNAYIIKLSDQGYLQSIEGNKVITTSDIEKVMILEDKEHAAGYVEEIENRSDHFKPVISQVTVTLKS